MAASKLAEGGLVAFATETVYGLGADARNDTAVARIFAAKGRPQFNPLIVHANDVGLARTLGNFNSVAQKLAEALWPGPLTIVVPRRADSNLSLLVSAGLDSVAIRVPAHRMAQDLLNAFGGPVAAPSANISGSISPTSAGHVIASLGEKVDVVLDGGQCPVGVESTIVSCLSETPVILRHGGVTRQQIEEIIGAPVSDQTDGGNKPVAPGQLTSHYAPRASVRLNVNDPKPGEVFLGFGPVKNATLNLSPSGDTVEAAANLFAMLHELDRSGAKKIAVAPIPNSGLGEAINDRLKRAAAPREGN